MDLLELFAFGPGWGDELLRGLAITLQMAVLSYAIGAVLGLLSAFAELSRWRLVSAAAQAYDVLLRSLPELLVIFLFYYGSAFALQALLGPFGITRIEVGPFTAGVAALSLILGAYAAQVFRGAITSVPHGLLEAGRALGLRDARVHLLITVPVAVRYAFPGLVNLWMVLIKITPLVSAIGLEDFIRSASTAGQNTKAYLAFYGAVLATYLLISGATMVVQARLSSRLFRHDDQVAR